MAQRFDPQCHSAGGVMIHLFDPRRPKKEDAPQGNNLEQANRILRSLWREQQKLGYGIHLCRFIWLLTFIIGLIGWVV